MVRETKDQVEQKMADLMSDMENISPGSEEYLKAAEALKKLSEILDSNEQTEISRTEVLNKEKDSKEQSRHQYIRSGIEIFGIVLPLTFYGVWMKKGFKFEETGTIVSSTFKNLISNFKPKRK